MTATALALAHFAPCCMSAGDGSRPDSRPDSRGERGCPSLPVGVAQRGDGIDDSDGDGEAAPLAGGADMLSAGGAPPAGAVRLALLLLATLPVPSRRSAESAPQSPPPHLSDEPIFGAAAAAPSPIAPNMASRPCAEYLEVGL